MAGFEIVVRPVVFPDIRPGRAQTLPPQDKPDQGIAVIGGSGGGVIETSYSWSVSVSHNRAHQETKRVFDKEKVYQKDEDGNINKDNFIEVERLKRLRLDGAPWLENMGLLSSAGEPWFYGMGAKIIFIDPDKLDNVETLQTDVVREAK